VPHGNNPSSTIHPELITLLSPAVPSPNWDSLSQSVPPLAKPDPTTTPTLLPGKPPLTGFFDSDLGD
jgi:hypothetical protein